MAVKYMSLPSLQAYLVAAKDEARVWLWQRGADGAFPKLPEECDSSDQALAIACLDVSVPLSDIYQPLPQS
jgi:hypothetical protein